MRVKETGEKIWAETLTREGRYPVVDPMPGYLTSIDYVDGNTVRANLAGKWTGELRPPRKGEYYLSGANVAAYRAPNDLTTAYHIARIVRIDVERRIIVTEHPIGVNEYRGYRVLPRRDPLHDGFAIINPQGTHMSYADHLAEAHALIDTYEGWSDGKG